MGNRFYRFLESQDLSNENLVVNSFKSPPEPHFSYISNFCKKTNHLSAFTLIEMMVVIGIIAIISLGVTPGLKKAYEDFKTRQDLENLDVLISSARAYALVMNEYPHRSFNGRWAYDANWTLPRYFTTGEQNGGGTINLLASDLTIIPHKGDGYLITQTLTEESGGLSIGMHGSNGAYNSLLRKRYPTYAVQGDFLYFPEVYHIDDELQEHRNRYY